MSRPTRPLVALALSGALLLAACGSDGEDASASSSASTSATSDSAEASASASEATETSGQGDAREELLAAIEAGQDQTQAFRFTSETTVDAGGRQQAVLLEGEGLTDPAVPSSDVVLTLPAEAGGLEVSSRQVGEEVFLRLPEVARGALGIVTPWLRVSDPAALQSLGVDPSTLDPTAQLRRLQEVLGDVERVGDDQVDGVDVTLYATSVDLSEAPGVTEQNRAELESTGLTGADLEIAVDGDGMVRRQVTTLAAPDGALTSVVTLVVEEYGLDVDVQAPPADEVSEPDPALLEQLSGGGAAPA